MEMWSQFRQKSNILTQETPEFRIENADFPALNCDIEQEIADQISSDERTILDSPTKLSDRTGRRDNYDLESFLEKLKDYPNNAEKPECDNVWKRYQSLCGLHECRVETVSKTIEGCGFVDKLVLGTVVSNPCKYSSHWEYGSALWPINPQNVSADEGRTLEYERVLKEIHNPGIFSGQKGPSLTYAYSEDCYELTTRTREELKRPVEQLNNEEILFFLFYVCGQDLSQLIASDRLYRRKWRWNIKHGQWFQIIRIVRRQPCIGEFYVFQPKEWRKVQITTEYDVEDFVHSPVRIPPPLNTEPLFKQLQVPSMSPFEALNRYSTNSC